MKKQNIVLFSVLLMAFALAGCRSARQAESPARVSRKPQNEQLIPLAQYPENVKAVSAKTSIALDYEGHAVTVKGRLRMRRDDVVQMTITAFGLMEIASIEFTPKGGYIIDRVNKRYAKVDFSSGYMKLAGLDFSIVQALFWNRLFIPGEEEAWAKTSEFSIESVGEQKLVAPTNQKALECKFYTDADYKQVQQTDLALQHYVATWGYGQFEDIDGYAFPTTFDVSVGGSSRTIGSRIMLTGVSTADTGWSGTTELSRYKKVELEQMFSLLNMLK